MSKISELLPKEGARTKSNDLFVTVDVEAGDLGTKNITRRELVQAIQQENFNSINITGGNIDNVNITNSTFDNPILDQPDIVGLPALIGDLRDEDTFLLTDVSSDTLVSFSWASFQEELAEQFVKTTKIYVSQDGYSANTANGSYLKPYSSIDEAFLALQQSPTPVSVSVLPGNYVTKGNLALPDNCSVVATNGQYATNIIMEEGYETNNAFLVGSSCYVQGFAFVNQRVDNFDNPSTGFAIAFRPGALILRSPYIRDCSQISNYRRETVAAPLNPRNSLGTIEDLGGDDHPNSLVGRGGGVLLADRSVLNQNSIFPYMLAFGATPRSPNGVGYVAKNGAGINGIGSITIFQRCAFYALNGGQVTLNNSGTQFGDISMRAKGSTTVVEPYAVPDVNVLIKTEVLADQIRDNSDAIIDFMWDSLETDLGYQGYDSVKCKRDTGLILDGVTRDLALDTNYWGIISGIAYRRAMSALVIDEQLTETAGALNFLRTSVANLLTDAPSITRTNASLSETIDILVNGSSSADTITFSDTGIAARTNARTQIQNNKGLLQTRLIAWISENFPNLNYNINTCVRDTGYIIDALAHDVNYGGNLATRLNAEAYFLGSSSQLPQDQKEPTAAAIDQLGVFCAQVVLEQLTGQNTSAGVGTQTEAELCKQLTGIISKVIRKDTLGALAIPYNPDFSWVASNFITSKQIIETSKASLQTETIYFINDTYDFIDENLTRRDAGNLIKSLAFDFQAGTQTSIRNYVGGFFDYKAEHVFRVFRPSLPGLVFKGTLSSEVELTEDLEPAINDAYIIADDPSASLYSGDIYYWEGSIWVNAGANNTSIMDSFIYAYARIRQYIVENLTISTLEIDMLDSLLQVLESTLQVPSKLLFGSLIESIGHQFNLAGAGVNKNALPLNFRRVGTPLAASGSVLQEDNGRVRWSGADELNNQYFARGLKINGRTGRLEGRPFTSSVRRLARRAANSRTLT